MLTLHLISHTHWDREWYLTFQQFRMKLVRLVDNLLDILAQDPQYLHYMLDGQTIVLEDYLAVRPECEPNLRRYIQEGRVLVGPWYILPDEFLVSPEAIIRNLLEGDRIARQFGPKMMVGYIPDPFGHIGQMPQILRGFGIETASVMRGLSDEPCELWWQSPDGSRVLMAYLRGSYGNAAGILGGSLEMFVADAAKICEEMQKHSAAPHVLLMHGVDHMEPQVKTSAAVAFAEDRLDGARLIHSTLPAYFAAVEAHLGMMTETSPVAGRLAEPIPTVVGELRSSKRHPLLPGVLSTRMWIKQRNKACETLLEKWAEPFSAWAEWTAGEKTAEGVLQRPEALLRQAWRLLLQCQPHDSICGCSIDQVHEEMRSRFDQAEQIGEEITQQSLEVLAGRLDTRPAGEASSKAAASPNAGAFDTALVVFNPVAGPRTDLVSVKLEALPKNGGFDLIDEHGNALPYEMVGLGGSELLNMVMDRSELRASFGTVADGVVMGWKIRDMQVRREANRVFIEMALIEKGLPDLAAWERGRQAVEQALEDAALTEYHILARTADAAQVQFSAPGVPGYGYRTFWLRSHSGVKKPPARLSPLLRALLPLAAKAASSPVATSPAGQRVMSWLAPDGSRKPPFIIENEFFRVEAQADGTLDVQDKTTGVLYRQQNRLVDGGDRGDEYNYSPPAVDQLVSARLKDARVERSAVQQALVLNLELVIAEELAADRKSRAQKRIILPVTSRVMLTQGVARVDIRTEVDNRARDHRLRVHFAAPFAVPGCAEYDGHFEVLQRPVGVPAHDASWVEQPRPETCQRAFTAVADGSGVGLMVANRGLPEVEVLRRADGNAEIALTLLRCVGWLSRDDLPERKGHAGPGIPTPGAQMPGKWAFEYAIIPHASAGRLAAIQQAYAFEAPLRAVDSGLHEGSFPGSGSFLQVEPGELNISAVKTAENQRGWLVRGVNLSAEPVTARLRLLHPFHSAERVNLAEEPLAPLNPEDAQSVALEVKGHQVVTLRFQA